MGDNFSVLLNFLGRLHCLLLGHFVFRTEASLRKLVSPRNDVWETSAKISCGWHVSTQIRLAAVNFPRDKNTRGYEGGWGGGRYIFLSRFILVSYRSLRGKLIQECSKVHGFLLQACRVPCLSYFPRLFPSWMLKTACSHPNENYWSAEYTGANHFTRKRLTSSPQNFTSVPVCT